MEQLRIEIETLKMERMGELVSLEETTRMGIINEHQQNGFPEAKEEIWEKTITRWKAEGK